MQLLLLLLCIGIGHVEFGHTLRLTALLLH
jgi:hypothetical protein